MDASPNLINYRLYAVIACTDAGGAPGKLYIYDTARPSAGEAPAGAPLVTVTLAYPCGVVAAGGVDLTDTDFSQALNSGTIVWARLVDSDDNWVADFKAGLESDPTAEVTMATVEVFAGAFIGLVGARLNALN